MNYKLKMYRLRKQVRDEILKMADEGLYNANTDLMLRLGFLEPQELWEEAENCVPEGKGPACCYTKNFVQSQHLLPAASGYFFLAMALDIRVIVISRYKTKLPVETNNPDGPKRFEEHYSSNTLIFDPRALDRESMAFVDWGYFAKDEGVVRISDEDLHSFPTVELYHLHDNDDYDEEGNQIPGDKHFMLLHRDIADPPEIFTFQIDDTFLDCSNAIIDYMTKVQDFEAPVLDHYFEIVFRRLESRAPRKSAVRCFSELCTTWLEGRDFVLSQAPDSHEYDIAVQRKEKTGEEMKAAHIRLKHLDSQYQDHCMFHNLCIAQHLSSMCLANMSFT